MTLDPSELCGLMEFSLQSEIECLGETDVILTKYFIVGLTELNIVAS